MTISTEKVTILAPHVDDELIGCYRLLDAHKVSDVYYFYDITPERVAEARHAASTFGFTPHFHEIDLADLKDKIVYVPNIRDKHPHHKEINHMTRNLNCRYYSIDMNCKYDVLSSKDAARKKLDLELIYPSQAKLLNSDDKYHLFESDMFTDIECSFYTDMPEHEASFEFSLLENEIPKDLLEKVNEIVYENPERSWRINLQEYTFRYNP